MARLRDWPILKRLLPRLRHLRHDPRALLASEPTAPDDVRIAKLALFETSEFTAKYGADWEEAILTVRLESASIAITERSVADDQYGKPFSSSDHRVEYPEFDGSRGVGLRVRERFPQTEFRALAALATRRWNAFVPCDLCGARVESFQLLDSGLRLHHWSCWGNDASVRIEPRARDILRRALPVQDLPAIRGLNPDWAMGYCPTCDASYCQRHFETAAHEHGIR